MNEVYNNYEEPIEAMKHLTALNIPFAFSHKKLDGTTVCIRKAILRPMAKSEFKNSKYKLQYTNLETNEHRSCYIPLLLSFNHKLIQLQ